MKINLKRGFVQKIFPGTLAGVISLWLSPFGALFFFYLSAPPLLADDSIRCDGSLFSIGDLQIEVKEKCGEPTEIIEYTEFTVIHSMYITSHKRHTLADRYIMKYDDASSYLEALKGFQNKNHSHDEIISPAKPRNPKDKKIKVTRIRENHIQESELETFTEDYDIYWKCKKYEDHFEEWVYNLGENRFVRIITFLRGRVVQIEHSGYGF